MGNVKPLNNKKYEISKHKFWEAYHFCMQYEDWKRELKDCESTVKSASVSGMPSSHNYQDQTARLIERRAKLLEKCELVEQTAMETDSDIYLYILEGVTHDYASYKYLKEVMHIPCGKDMYYDRRRKFYYILSNKI